MTARRLIAVAVILVVAVLAAPAAQTPGFNSADAIVVGAPLALVAVGLWPRRASPRRRSTWISDTEKHPEALSRLDGAGIRRPSL